MKTSTRALPLALWLALSSGVALAQAAGTGSSVTGGQSAPAAQPGIGTRNVESRKDDQLARGDRKFIREAAEHGMYEVEAAQLAQTKASSPDVKSFASMLVDHHMSANNELVQFANSRKVELPAAPPHGKRRAVERLGKLTGDAFDRRFVREVGIKDHEQGIRKLERAGKDVKDAQLKAWIDKTLPRLREHLAAAQKLPQAGKVDASAMGNRAAPRSDAGGDLANTAKGAATATNTGGKTGS